MLDRGSSGISGRSSFGRPQVKRKRSAQLHGQVASSAGSFITEVGRCPRTATDRRKGTALLVACPSSALCLTMMNSFAFQRYFATSCVVRVTLSHPSSTCG